MHIKLYDVVNTFYNVFARMYDGKNSYLFKKSIE